MVNYATEIVSASKRVSPKKKIERHVRLRRVFLASCAPKIHIHIHTRYIYSRARYTYTHVTFIHARDTHTHTLVTLISILNIYYFNYIFA